MSSNWDNGVPDTTDTAEFDRGAGYSYAVTLGGRTSEITTHRLLVGSNSVTLSPNLVTPADYHVVQDILIASEPFDTAAVLNINQVEMTAAFATVGYYYNTANGTLNIGDNARLTVTASQAFFDEELLVGSDGTGTLNISGGADFVLNGADGDITLGQYGGTGTATITGAGSTLSTADGLFVGWSGTGTVNVISGGQLNTGVGYIGYNHIATGQVGVTGVGSAWTNTGDLYIGYAKYGLLEITDGASVSNSGAYIGYDQYLDIANARIALAVGVARVIGAQSTWSNNSIYVGYYGDGTLEILEGGSVTSSVLRVGVNATSTYAAIGSVIVDGSDSTLTASSQIIVGDYGQGSVEVTSGGQVNGNLAAGFQGADSIGEIRIDGPGSAWTGTVIRIGYIYGEGILEITNGGKLSAYSSAVGATAAMLGGRGSATVDGAGSLWSSTENLRVGVSGAGAVSITSGGTVSVGGLLTIGSIGEMRGDGNVIGNVQNSGLVSPGNSLGPLSFDGDYTQLADGELLIQLASTSGYDQLLVTGIATLAGTLQIDLLDGFMPIAGRTYSVLIADDVNGTFNTEVIPAVSNLTFDVMYTDNSVVLTVLSTLPGDYNGNGVVDAADYTVWRDTLGQTGLFLAADGNQNDEIDAGDYQFWVDHFGETAGGSATVASGGSPGANYAAPEPSTITLMLIGLVASRLRFTRRGDAIPGGRRRGAFAFAR